MIEASQGNNFAIHEIVVAVVGESAMFQPPMMFRFEAIHGGFAVRVRFSAYSWESWGKGVRNCDLLVLYPSDIHLTSGSRASMERYL